MVPQFPNKHQHPALIDGRSVLARRQPLAFPPPDTVVFCYHRPLLNRFRWRSRRVQAFYGETRLMRRAGPLGRCALVGNFGVGAPALAVLLEDWAAFGVQQFVSIGVAGGLQPTLMTGEVVMCERALRDEGTSHHYVAPERFATASAEWTAHIADIIRPERTGASWTTDAPYRETAQEVEAYRAAGLLTVDMEAAALFAVGRYLGVQTAAILVVGDKLTANGWSLDFDGQLVEKRLAQVVRAVVV